MKKNINWFWAHRRNASLHHFSFLIDGLSKKGWKPVVNFWFDNQIVIGVPEKGCYLFYDRDQLSSDDKYRDIQKSIDKNPNFAKDFTKRTDEIFDSIFSRCNEIDKANLKNLSKKDLMKLYDKFMKTIMVGPIITVQLWGIEACLDENYIIIKFLKDKLKNPEELQIYKDLLLVNEGETIAFSEKKDFYRVVAALDKPKIVRLFRKNIRAIDRGLEKFRKENNLVNKHTQKYYWVNTEYISESWSRTKWLEVFKKALLDDKKPKVVLKELLDQFDIFVKKKKEAIKKLNLPKDVRHAIDSLSEFIAQRDWTKGYIAKTFLSYHKLLNEIADRIGIGFNEIILYSYREIYDYLQNEKVLSKKEIKNRKKNGFALVVKGGKSSLITGKKNIRRVIEKEKISEPFEELARKESFKGMPASLGKVVGRARVIDDVMKLKDFKDGEILITYMTTVEFIPLFKKAIAVVTDEGGMSCHAAIISREFKLPCIVGTKVATRIIKTGNKIEVDANSGIVKIIKHMK